MGEKTGIAWTDSTWNPVRGCTKVSAGCKNCYAETFAERWRGVPGHAFEQGFDLRLVPEALDLPLRWRKPRRVFVNSMSDLFHPDVPLDFIEAVFGVMSLAGRHTFQILTKRPKAMRTFMEGTTLARCQAAATWMDVDITTAKRKLDRADDQVINGPWPLPNVWLGTSVEDQRAADERIPELLATPAAVRFLSCEPLLGPITFRPQARNLGEMLQLMDMEVAHKPEMLGGIDWVIIGGESGAGARPCDVAWVRSLVQQCRQAGARPFVKQLGAFVEDRNDAGFDGDTVYSWPDGTEVEHNQVDTGYQGAPVRVRLVDRKGGVVTEWPSDLRVQQFPEVP